MRIRKDRPKRDPKLLVGIAVELGAATVMIASMLAIVLFFVRGGFIAQEPSNFRFGTAGHLVALANAQETIAQLNAVIAGQRDDVAGRQRALEQLKAEHDQIARMLSMERASIDAIFEEQRAKNQEDIWKERAVGCLLGVLSGMLTALILHWIKLWRGLSS